MASKIIRDVGGTLREFLKGKGKYTTIYITYEGDNTYSAVGSKRDLMELGYMLDLIVKDVIHHQCSGTQYDVILKRGE